MESKRYYALDEFYKEKFGSKVFKVSLDAGFSCPNKDGTKGYGGCIFCNGTPYVGDKLDSIEVQFDKVKSMLEKKWPNAKYIPFFEANTNTYAPLEELRRVYEKVLSFDNVVGLNIATRCDAFTDEIFEYLKDLNTRTFLTIELGLQSSDDRTLKYINRGHTKEEFAECVRRLKSLNINVVVHVINGLPYETESMMIETVRFVNSLNVDGIKFHMLYIEKGTALEKIYEREKFHILSFDEYMSVLAKQLKILNKNIVIHRLISGPDLKKLVEPRWLVGKFRLLNGIEKYLEEHDVVQGSRS